VANLKAPLRMVKVWVQIWKVFKWAILKKWVAAKRPKIGRFQIFLLNLTRLFLKSGFEQKIIN
jgi:hypothetical protein